MVEYIGTGTANKNKMNGTCGRPCYLSASNKGYKWAVARIRSHCNSTAKIAIIF